MAAAAIALRTGIAAQPATSLDPRRLSQNPLITVTASATLGDNVNGPTVIRVPDWVDHPLGKYYLYFANHMGTFIRFAYASAVEGPWTIFEPGVLDVRSTAFYREQPDPVETLDDFYTHVASPEVLVDAAQKRFVMWTHGWWTRGERWPYTQASVSTDGMHFTVQSTITRTSYIRVFARGSSYFGVSRLGLVSRATTPLDVFTPGPNLFRDSAYAGRVRHVALVLRGDRLHVFFTGIGDAPERILMSTVDLTGDWSTWRATPPVDVLTPTAAYECADRPNQPSESGDISTPVKQIRDPFVFEDEGRTFLFYSVCGEQGIAAAQITLP